MKTQTVSTVAELLAASEDANVRTIEVRGELADVPPSLSHPRRCLSAQVSASPSCDLAGTQMACA